MCLTTTTELRFQGQIGKGAFGVVKKAQYNGILVAVKEFSEVADEEAEAQAEFEKEIQILSQISSHPNVVILVVRSRLQSACGV